MRLAAVAAFVIVTAGCTQAPESEAAQVAVERAATGAREVDCTSRSTRWFREGPPAERFLCVARRAHGRCDRYLVERAGSTFTVRATERDTVDCALPAG